MSNVVCFLCNHTRTIFFHRIATGLEKKGYEICWISSGRRWARWLEGQGTPKEKILDLANFGSEWCTSRDPTPGELAHLALLERSGNVTARDIILMDRVLRRGSLNLAVRYLAVCASQIDAFFEREGVDVVFGEQTWGYELIAGKCAERRGIPVYQPAETRIPWARFVFFKSHLFAEIAEVKAVESQNYEAGARIWADFVRSKKKPEYFYRNARVPRPHLDWPLKLVRHLLSYEVERHDMAAFPTGYLVEWRFAQTVNTLAMRLKTPFEIPDLKKAPPFVVMMLHVQPENTLDVMASRFTNQTEVVRALARALPVTHELWIKEHAGAIGDRSLAYYRDLKRNPRVRLIDPWVNAFSLAEKADLVVSIGGTVCYEASLLGRKAMTLTPMYFSRIVQAPIVDIWSPDAYRRIADALAAPAWPPAELRERCIEFLAWLHANSFPGEIGDPVQHPDSMSEENVGAVLDGFTVFLRDILARPRLAAAVAN